MTIDEARYIICEWMEPTPKLKQNGQLPRNSKCLSFSDLKWWRHRAMTVPYLFPVDLTLDRLRLVEERLMQRTDPPPKGSVNWEDAIDSMLCSVLGETHQWHWHASADEKTLALAAVIRGTETAVK